MCCGFQERLQDLWEVYQRLGLEDDIVDPSNELLREGPVHKISFRRSDPMERYLFLVRSAGRGRFVPPWPLFGTASPGFSVAVPR